MRFKKFGISGNSVQETSVQGKNYFTGNKIGSGTEKGVEYNFNNSILNLNGTVTSSGNIILDQSTKVKIPAGTYTYTINVNSGTFEIPSGDFAVYLMSGPNTFITGVYGTSGITGTSLTNGEGIFSRTLTITEETEIYLRIFSSSANIVFNNLELFMQIESGSSYTGLEQFIPNMPSTDYRSEVKSCGDNINKFDKNDSIQQDYIFDANGNLSANVGGYFTQTIYIKVKTNTTYTISATNIDYFRICEYANDKTFIQRILGSGTQKYYTFTTSSTTEYIRVSCNKNNLNSIKLEEGSKPTPYSPYGQGCINEVICNKNIFNPDLAVNNTYQNINNSWIVSTLNYAWTSGLQSIKENTQCSGNYLRVTGVFDEKEKNVIKKNAIYQKTTFTTPQGACYVDFTIYKETLEYENAKQIQIVEGTELGDYEEHKEQTYTIPTQQPIRAVGNIRDTFIKKDGKRHEHHPIFRKIFDGTENWSNWGLSNQTNTKAYVLRNFPKASSFVSNEAGCRYLSSHFLFNENNNYDNDKELLYINEKNAVGIRLNIDKVPDLTTFKAYLAEQYNAGTPVYIDYILAEPIDIECTPEQNKILDKIEQEAHTYKNVTHIYSTDEVKPVKDVEYYTDTQMNETFAKIQEMEGLKKDVNNFKEITVNVAQFGAVGNGITDDTEAIQNAINNAGFGGTVEFEKGKDYLVSSTIFVGIGQTLNFNFSNITPATNGKFTNNYVFSINSSDVENWDNAYSSRTTIINKLKADNINLIENLKLMYAPCNLKINWLFSRRFYGSVDSGNFYADMYELNDIYIYDNFGDNYAIYKRGQGDAFVVNKMLVGVFLDNSNMNAISVGSTAGCQLNDVIGGNYSFYNSRSVSINNAHIEVGRIVIKNSQVEINNSYLWKDGANSTIEISDSAVANSKDINFPVVLNNVIFKIRNVKYTYTIEHGDIDISNFNGLLELNNVMRVNEIDSNNYFYESITGISIKTATDTYINTVDNKTCIRNKVIEPVRKIFTTLKSGYYTLTNCSTFESDRSWQGTAGKEYFYKVLVLNDTKRMCGINETNVTSATVKSATPASSQNVLLNLGKVAGMSLRILRGSALNTFEEYVDIPFCQSRVLVDTGACINGFKWKTNSSGTYPTINNIFSEDFITNYDGNVHCFGKEKPTVGTWKAGDIVYDITGTTMGWRCTTDGTPGTWIEM